MLCFERGEAGRNLLPLFSEGRSGHPSRSVFTVLVVARGACTAFALAVVRGVTGRGYDPRRLVEQRFRYGEH